MQLQRIPCNYIITHNTSPHLLPLPWTDSPVFKTISWSTHSYIHNRLFVCLGFDFVLFWWLVGGGLLLVLFFWRSLPHFSSAALTDQIWHLESTSFAFQPEQTEVKSPSTKLFAAQHSTSKPAQESTTTFMLLISENKCNVCRNFRPCQKMPYHCASKPYLYTVATEICKKMHLKQLSIYNFFNKSF